MAFTDLHFGQLSQRVDDATVEDMISMSDLYLPDLIAVTGDAWFENTNGRGIKLCEYFCRVMSGLGRPWAFVRGNHDKADDFSVCEQMFASTPGSLYHGFGNNGNYRVRIMNSCGNIWNLIFINDSRPKIGFRISQVNWLRSECEQIKKESKNPVPAMIFCHIPIDAFRQMILSGVARGICLEDISSQKCHAEAMPTLAKSGLVKAMFCGHDHVNNFKGLWQGIHLEYLRSTGWAGYGGKLVRKGGTLIEVSRDGTFSSKTVFANGQEWFPTFKAGTLRSLFPKK